MMSVIFIISCSKKDTTETSSMNNDSLASDSSAAIPNPAPQTDTTASMSNSGSSTDSTSTSSSARKDSAK